MSDMRVAPSPLPMAGNVEPDDAASATAGTHGLNTLIQELQGLLATLPTAVAQNQGGIVSTPGGAPMLAASTMDFTPDGLFVALAEAQQKNQQTQVSTATLGIQADSKKKEAETKRNIEKIKEWVDKFNEAAAKAKAGGILGWFKKIFTAVAAALAVVAAGLATAATGGAAAPLLAIATLTLVSSLVSIASEIDKANGGKGFDGVLKYLDIGSLVGMGIGELAKELGASDKVAGIVSTVVAVATTVAIMVATVVLTGGAGAGAAVDGISKTILTAARIGQAVAGIAAGVTQVAEGALDISVAGSRRDADRILAEQKDIQTILAKLQQQIEENRGDLEKVLNAMLESMTLISGIINSNGASRTQITANMAAKSTFI